MKQHRQFKHFSNQRQRYSFSEENRPTSKAKRIFGFKIQKAQAALHREESTVLILCEEKSISKDSFVFQNTVR